MTDVKDSIKPKQYRVVLPADQAAKAYAYHEVVNLTENTPTYNFVHAILTAFASRTLRRDMGKIKAAVATARTKIDPKDLEDKKAMRYGADVAYYALKWAHVELSRDDASEPVSLH